jgi:hypothetical protein
MKIVNLKQFFELPDGVLYSKYKPCYFDGLYIKLETIRRDNGEPVDFCYKNLIAELDVNDSDEFIDILVEAEKTNEHIKLDFDCSQRDGLYDDEQMFAIYSQEDILNLSKVIAGCVSH